MACTKQAAPVLTRSEHPGPPDVVHAHSVFSHSLVEVIGECLAHVGVVMKPHQQSKLRITRRRVTIHLD